MKHVKIRSTAREPWRVLGGTKRSQAARMVIEPGDSEGGPDNRHRGDQWLYVVAGTGAAHVGRKTVRLSRGSLLLIASGQTHGLRAKTRLVTFNISAPPQY